MATLNVQTYGALGDGIQDDTTYIQAAINAAQTGDTVYIPKTDNFYLINTITYNADPNYSACTAALTIEKGITLYSNGATLKVANHSNLFNATYPSSVITIGGLCGGNTTFDGATIDGLIIDGNSVNNWDLVNGVRYYQGSGDANIGFLWHQINLIRVGTDAADKYITNITIKNCTLMDSSHTGIGVGAIANTNGVRGLLIDNNTVTLCQGDQISVACASSVTVSNNFCNNAYADSIHIYRLVSNSVVTNNNIRFRLSEIDLTKAQSYIWFPGTSWMFYGSLKIGHSDYGNVTGVRFYDNNLDGAIMVVPSGASNTIVEKNVFTIPSCLDGTSNVVGTQIAALSIAGDYTEVFDNYFHDCIKPAIYIANDHSTIRNNRFFNCHTDSNDSGPGGPSTNAACFIYCSGNASQAAPHYIIRDNKFTAGVDGPKYCYATTPDVIFDHVLIEDNDSAYGYKLFIVNPAIGNPDIVINDFNDPQIGEYNSELIQVPYYLAREVEDTTRRKLATPIIFNSWTAQSIVYELIKNWMLANSPDTVGFPFKANYSEDTSKSDIVLDISYNYDLAIASKRPAVFIGREDIKIMSPTMRQTAAVDSIESETTKFSINSLGVRVTIIAQPVMYAELLAEYVKMALLSFQSEIKRDFGLRRFAVVAHSKPEIYVEAKDNFKITLMVEVAYDENWVVKREDFKWKTVALDIFNSITPIPIEPPMRQ